MSFTAVYRRLRTLDDGDFVRIEDLNGLKDALSDTIEDQMKLAERKTDEYPAKAYKYLKGFRTYDEETYSEEYNIERLGAAYSGEDYVEFWEKVSRYTQPFYFLHSPHANKFPTLLEAFGGDDSIYVTECIKGKVWTYKVSISGEVEFKEHASSNSESNRSSNLAKIAEHEGWSIQISADKSA